MRTAVFPADNGRNNGDLGHQLEAFSPQGEPVGEVIPTEEILECFFEEVTRGRLGGRVSREMWQELYSEIQLHRELELERAFEALRDSSPLGEEDEEM